MAGGCVSGGVLAYGCGMYGRGGGVEMAYAVSDVCDSGCDVGGRGSIGTEAFLATVVAERSSIRNGSSYTTLSKFIGSVCEVKVLVLVLVENEESDDDGGAGGEECRLAG
jgi:hypothetical protein